MDDLRKKVFCRLISGGGRGGRKQLGKNVPLMAFNAGK